MDLDEGLHDRVGPFRELFNESNDVLHPLKFSTGLELNLALPLSNAFGVLTRLCLPDTSQHDERAQRIVSSSRVLSGRALGYGAYLVSRGGKDASGRRSRSLVSAMQLDGGPADVVLEHSRPGSLVRATGLVTKGGQVEGGLTGEYTGSDFSATAKVATDGSLYASYHQRLAAGGLLSRVTAGGETLVSDLLGKTALFPATELGPQRMPALSYALGGSFELPSWDARLAASFKQIRMGAPSAEVVYAHSITGYVTAFSALEYRHRDAFSKALLGFRTKFPRTRSVFTGSVTSGGEIRGEYERRLLSNVKAAVHVDGTLWPAAGKQPRFDVGVKLTVGSHPTPFLDLTPVLMRDGPRSWQK